MPMQHLVVLALVQGITEFLPISSQAHLILIPVLTGWPDQTLMVDVALHVGTLGAVMLYLWRDLWSLTCAVLRPSRWNREPEARLAGYLVVATVPVVVAGMAVNYLAAEALRNVTVIGWATLGFGIVLYLADRHGMTVRRMEHMGLADAVIIGLAQALALVPGTSRSGITMTAARVLGLERLAAARFSMLLSIPTIIGAGALKGFDLAVSGDVRLTAAAVVAAGLAFAAALVAIVAMMAWLRRATFLPFVIYRLALGAALLGLVYGAPGLLANSR